MNIETTEGLKDKMFLNSTQIKRALVSLIFCSFLVFFLPYSGTGATFISSETSFMELLFAILPLIAVTASLFIQVSKSTVLAVLLPLTYFHFLFSMNQFYFSIWTAVPAIAAFIQMGLPFVYLYLVVALWLNHESRENWTSKTLNSAVVATFIGILYVVGTWMNWERTTWTITKGESIWTLNQSKVRTSDCCVLFSSPDDWSSQFIDLFKVLGIFVLIYSFFYLFNYFYLGIGFITLGLILTSFPLQWLSGDFPKDLNPTVYGYTNKEVSEMGLIMTSTTLPGGWIALGSAFGMIFFGLYFVGKSRISEDN